MMFEVVLRSRTGFFQARTVKSGYDLSCDGFAAMIALEKANINPDYQYLLVDDDRTYWNEELGSWKPLEEVVVPSPYEVAPESDESTYKLGLEITWPDEPEVKEGSYFTYRYQCEGTDPVTGMTLLATADAAYSFLGNIVADLTAAGFVIVKAELVTLSEAPF